MCTDVSGERVSSILKNRSLFDLKTEVPETLQTRNTNNKQKSMYTCRVQTFLPLPLVILADTVVSLWLHLLSGWYLKFFLPVVIPPYSDHAFCVYCVQV